MNPVRTSVTNVTRRAMTSSLRMEVYLSDEPEGGEAHVDELDADEWGNDPAHAVEEQRAPQDGGGAERAVLHAAQRERDEQDDDDGVENDGREDGRERRREVHDVQRRDLREDA